MIPESFWFSVDDDGHYHLPFDAPWLRVRIDVHGLAWLDGVKVIPGDGIITIECDGRILVYDRVGTTLEDHWICDLRIGDGDS